MFFAFYIPTFENTGGILSDLSPRIILMKRSFSGVPSEPTIKFLLSKLYIYTLLYLTYK
jgi:hypothetical protein